MIVLRNVNRVAARTLGAACGGDASRRCIHPGGGETSGEAKPAARSTAPLFQWPEEGDPKVGFEISKNSRGLT